MLNISYNQASDEMFLCEMHFVDINYLDQNVRQYTKERRTSTWLGLVFTKGVNKGSPYLEKVPISAITLFKESTFL